MATPVTRGELATVISPNDDDGHLDDDELPPGEESGHLNNDEPGEEEVRL